jgi:hypothetical protein
LPYIGVLIALIVMSPQARVSTSPSASSDVVVIDGSKNPSMLPEWLVWEQAFLIISGWQGKDSGITHELRMALAREELELLEREAGLQGERQEHAGRDADPLRARFAARDPNDTKLLALLNDQMQEVNLKYRRATLEARNRVFEHLSPESQSVLMSWIGDIRAGIVSKVAKSDLERWRAPE